MFAHAHCKHLKYCFSPCLLTKWSAGNEPQRYRQWRAVDCTCVRARVYLSQYSWRTCLVRTQVTSSWAGGGAKFVASCLVKLRGVAVDSLWRSGSRGPFPTSWNWIITYLLCIWICAIRVYKTDGLTSQTSLHLPVIHSTCWCLLNVSIRKHERFGVGLHRKQWWVSVCPPHIILWCQGHHLYQNCN